MRPLLDLLMFGALLLVELRAPSLSPRAAVDVAGALGEVWYRVDGRRRRRARESLRLAMRGGLEVEDPEALVRATFRSLMMVPVEVLVLPRFFRSKHDVVRRCTFHGDWAGFREDVHAGRGGIAVAGHLGSWELAAWCLRFLGVPARVVVRPIENPWIDARAAAARGGAGSVIAKRGAVREVLRTLEAKAWVAIMADQNAGSGGVFVDFFGLPARTYATPAVLAHRTRLPIWAAACIRRHRPALTYEIHVRRLGPPPAGADEDEAAAFLLRQFVGALEGWIRRAPEQYNWVHRRWKNRPPDEVPGPGTPRYDHRVSARS